MVDRDGAIPKLAHCAIDGGSEDLVSLGSGRHVEHRVQRAPEALVGERGGRRQDLHWICAADAHLAQDAAEGLDLELRRIRARIEIRDERPRELTGAWL